MWSVQFSSVAQSRPTLCDPMDCSSQSFLFITNSQSLLKLMSIKSVMPSNHLILCRPLLLLPSIFPSIRVFSNESALLIRWPKYWSVSFSISPSNEYSELTSFRIDWCDLLAVQGTLYTEHIVGTPYLITELKMEKHMKMRLRLQITTVWLGCPGILYKFSILP